MSKAYFDEKPNQSATTEEVDEESKEAPALNKLVKHPFAGYMTQLVSLVCSLTYRQNQSVEDFMMTEDGKLRLGAILSHTKMDVDNPMLREWCLVIIRNLCSWSEAIRTDLAKLKLIEVSPEAREQLNQLGVRELFERELSKLKKKDADGNTTETYENHNVHFDTVDF